jgi:hypothetical protein
MALQSLGRQKLKKKTIQHYKGQFLHTQNSYIYVCCYVVFRVLT